ncbi:right-handed parallel beta-helix repeat-containing protein [Noviherbaspirillum sp. UKPF54]|uniref:right-handed parallel beta-helix repeat-containing protein n=1 Tax=Noviherbaspirillum sp. UKPF54 TaxID=2601898 RepID=UPI0011B191C3|nr:right-handed parallel beta-helix repeat-containing protein [Noviherbaspirillum sp. UKPF54]QDZ28358.1 right-handed parallel beta-helix repeat-containing protein [Noviherbaspirillum sp. UKPF54]
MTGCGGSGSPAATPSASAAATTGTTPAASAAPSAVQSPAEAIAAPDLTQPALALPANIANGSVVSLQCGRTYSGTLDLAGKSNVTVRTEGGCGKAVITPGQAIDGWSLYQGNIYSAPIAFDAAQVLVDGQPLARAHWPSRSQTWARAGSSSGASLAYPMPNGDLAGATLLFRPNDWAIEARTITGYSAGSMSLASTGKVSFDGYALSGQPDFYVEGKLWMLDEPGEWAVSGGRLYVWTADGKSPQGRVVASPDRDGINARNAQGITVDGVSIYAAANGINALDAKNLRVTATDIANSSENGILNSGGSGLYVDGASIRNSRHDAIAVKWGGGGDTVRNSTIDASGVIGMPTNAHAAVNLTVGVGSTVSNNTVTNSGYIGIRAFRNASVTQNTVDGACMVLTDCGGMYFYTDDGQALNTVVDGNTIANVGGSQKLAWAIDLDAASGVTVSNNTITASANGMQLHDGGGNTISGNRFSASRQAHIQMDEDGSAPSVRNNVVKNNVFTSKNGEETYRISSTLGADSVAQFAAYSDNAYTSSSATFANFNGELLNYTQWKARTGQDASSTFQAQ